MANHIESFNCPGAPKPLGNYAHAVIHGEMIYLSGIASRNPATNEVPGLRLDVHGNKTGYDIRAETRGTLENIRTILEAAGSGMDRVVEISVYLLEMKDFAAYNEIFAEFFSRHRPARTTIGVNALPGNIAIEMKVTAVKNEF